MCHEKGSLPQPELRNEFTPPDWGDTLKGPDSLTLHLPLELHIAPAGLTL